MAFKKGQTHTPEALEKMRIKRDAYLARVKGQRRRPICPRCGERPKAEGRKYCIECGIQRRREIDWRRQYGLSPDGYQALLKDAGGCCAICAATNDLVVDHNHQTKHVRGILCRRCNWALGGLRDDMQLVRRAFTYLSMTDETAATNTALCDQAALVKLLIAKGIITDDEYFEAIATEMEAEVKRYEERSGLHLA